MNTMHMPPLKQLMGNAAFPRFNSVPLSKAASGKYHFSLLGFILVPETRQEPACLPQPLSCGMVPASRAEPKSSWGSLPREEVIGSPKVIHNYCRLGREMPYTLHPPVEEEHSCVGILPSYWSL